MGFIPADIEGNVIVDSQQRTVIYIRGRLVFDWIINEMNKRPLRHRRRPSRTIKIARNVVGKTPISDEGTRNMHVDLVRKPGTTAYLRVSSGTDGRFC